MAKATVAVAKNQTKTPTKLPSIHHPPYFQMICEAISTLKERTGSSQQAVAKFIEEKHGKSLPPNFKKTLSVQLKKFVKSEKLVKVKNSFKISATQKDKIGTKKSAGGSAAAKKKAANKASNSAVKKKVAKKVAEKAKKTKRLSQVKTPEALKRKKALPSTSKAKKDVKKNLTPMKRKGGTKSVNSSRPPPKKARK